MQFVSLLDNFTPRPPSPGIVSQRLAVVHANRRQSAEKCSDTTASPTFRCHLLRTQARTSHAGFLLLRPRPPPLTGCTRRTSRRRHGALWRVELNQRTKRHSGLSRKEQSIGPFTRRLTDRFSSTRVDVVDRPKFRLSRQR